MRTILPRIALAAFLALSAASAPAATIRVPADYPSIQTALDAAREGDSVEVADGTYPENLKLKSGVRLLGAGPDKTIILFDPGAGPGLTISKCSDSHASGLSFKYDPAKADRAALPRGGSLGAYAAVWLSGSKATIENCEASETAHWGFVLDDDGDYIMRSCRAAKNGQGGVLVGSAKTRAVIEKTVCEENALDGILVAEVARVELIDNICRRNGSSGIIARRAPASGLIKGNRCEANQHIGITIAEGARDMTVEGNVCNENLRDGINVSGKSAATLLSNECRGNRRWGAAVHDGSIVSVQKCKLLENREVGLAVSGQGSDCQAAENELEGNHDSGLLVWSGGSATLKASRSSKNWEHGVEIMKTAGPVTLAENSISENLQEAVFAEPGAPAPRLDNNTLKDNNREISESFLQALLAKENYAELEKIGARLRETNALYRKTGQSQLSDFYRFLGDGVEADRQKNPKGHLDRLEKWKAAFPKSPTPLVAIGKAQVALAWDARGMGVAPTVSEKGWKGFAERLEEAAKSFDAADKLKPPDPETYAMKVKIAMGRSEGRIAEDRAFKAGQQVRPDFYPLYHWRAQALMPRWGGEPGEMEEFALREMKSAEKTDGRGMYARIAIFIADKFGDDAYFFEADFDWKLLKPGLQDLIKHHPDADLFADWACLMACLAKDADFAEELFAKIGDSSEWGVWVADSRRNRWRDWAKSGGSSPWPGPTPVFYLARHADAETVLAELDKTGADVNVRDDLGRTLLHIAARHNDLDLARALLKRGANPRFADDYNYRPANYSQKGSDMESVLAAKGGKAK